MEEAKFGKPEENLSAYFEELIKNEMTTSEEMVSKKNRLQELFRFLEAEGPFDVVVDGLNVAMHPRHGLDFDAVNKFIFLNALCSSYYIIIPQVLVQVFRNCKMPEGRGDRGAEKIQPNNFKGLRKMVE